jgi:hypothetical protein
MGPLSVWRPAVASALLMVDVMVAMSMGRAVDANVWFMAFLLMVMDTCQ